ncbi:MAG: hypothetical protein ABEJ68_10325 [Halobacteriaceae archaeon]
MTDRAQSETLGFVLVFAVIMMTIGTVYVAGFSELDQSRQQTEIRNMERAFEVLSENLEDVYKDGAPRRATEVKLGEGTISYGDRVYMTVNATEIGNVSNHSPALNVSMTPILYEVGETKVVYSAGAVFRQAPTYTAMRSGPGWLISDDHVAISQIQTSPAGPRRSIGGPGTVLITASGRTPNVIRFAPDSRVRVNVTIQTPRTAAWKRQFEAAANSITVDQANSTVRMQFVADNATVVRTGISLDIQT